MKKFQYDFFIIFRIKNKIILAILVILVFFMPYVIPMPKESILEEIPSTIELKSIKHTSKYNMHKLKKWQQMATFVINQNKYIG